MLLPCLQRIQFCDHFLVQSFLYSQLVSLKPYFTKPNNDTTNM